MCDLPRPRTPMTATRRRSFGLSRLAAIAGAAKAAAAVDFRKSRRLVSGIALFPLPHLPMIAAGGVHVELVDQGDPQQPRPALGRALRQSADAVMSSRRGSGRGADA